ncbi:MAG: hypothetical protein KC419_01790 [Anaerolineales bacterium]|nr:hypothetical protein [Anaerolineales bacterium]
MSRQRWWHWLRTIRDNPVYRREKGEWGSPNPFYEKLTRYSPFLVIGAIVLGLCAGSTSNTALLAGNDELFVFWCLLCLPGMLLSMLTIFATFMAPALTAPAVSLEIDRGTWDILRMTPQPTGAILLAKLLGALARLRIWLLLFLLSLFQGLLITCVSAVSGGELGLWGMALGISTIFRPWVEILFAAFLGMFVSTWVRSATLALVGTYVGILVIKFFNNSVLWLGIGSGVFGVESNSMFVSGTVGPVVVYMLLLPVLALGIVWRAEKIGVES